MPMKLRLEPMADDLNKFAVDYGPIVLAGTLGTEGYQAPIPFAGNNPLKYARVPDPQVSLIADVNSPVDQWARLVADKPWTFTTDGVGRPKEVTLVPVTAANRQRYTVYWDRLSSGRETSARLAAGSERHFSATRPGKSRPSAG